MRTIELPQCTLTLEDGIIVCDQKREVEQTPETVERLIDAVAEISEEPPRLLVLMNGQPTSKEARAKLAQASFRAVAMVLSSTTGTMLVNFFLRFNRPGYPMRVFTSKMRAKEWLDLHADRPDSLQDR